MAWTSPSEELSECSCIIGVGFESLRKNNPGGSRVGGEYLMGTAVRSFMEKRWRGLM